jgi:hypothetical protein
MIVIADDTETTIGTDLEMVVGITIETAEGEVEEIHTAHQGKKKDVWVEMHTVALAQERVRRAPSSSRAEAI